MSLDTTANNSVISHSGRVATIVNNITIFAASRTVCMVMVLTDDTARQSVFGGDGASSDFESIWRADLAGDEFQAFMAHSTTNATSVVAAANFAAYGLNKPIFYAVNFVENGAAAVQTQYMGDYALPASEPSSYVSRTGGVGGLVAPTNTVFRVGNAGVLSRELHARVFWCGVWDYALDFSLIKRVQRIVMHRTKEMVPAGYILYCFYGNMGTGDQFDYSNWGCHGSVSVASQGVNDYLVPKPKSYAISRRSWLHPAVVGRYDNLLMLGVR